MNEDALWFDYSVDTPYNRKGEKEIVRILETSAIEPVTIEFPLLGYFVNVNLDRFSIDFVNEKPNTLKYFGYFYYRYFTANNPKQEAKYEKERKKVYYNSRIHFCRAVYNNTLSENGFIVLERELDEEEGKYTYNPVNFHGIKNENGFLVIENMKDILFYIYYCHKKGMPVDLLEKIAKLPENKKKDKILKFAENSDIAFRSQIRFLNDTCYIRSNGNILDDSILFDGYLARNRAGAMLPDDYYPKE